MLMLDLFGLALAVALAAAVWGRDVCRWIGVLLGAGKTRFN